MSSKLDLSFPQERALLWSVNADPPVPCSYHPNGSLRHSLVTRPFYLDSHPIMASSRKSTITPPAATQDNAESSNAGALARNETANLEVADNKDSDEADSENDDEDHPADDEEDANLNTNETSGLKTAREQEREAAVSHNGLMVFVSYSFQVTDNDSQVGTKATCLGKQA